MGFARKRESFAREKTKDIYDAMQALEYDSQHAIFI